VSRRQKAIFFCGCAPGWYGPPSLVPTGLASLLLASPNPHSAPAASVLLSSSRATNRPVPTCAANALRTRRFGMKADEGVGPEEGPPLGEEEFDSSVMDTPEQPPPDTTEADEALAAMLESGGRRKRGSALKAAEKIQTAMSTAPLKVGRDPRSCRLPSHCCLLTHGLRNLCPSSRPLRRSPPPWNVTALRLPPSRDPVPVGLHPPRVCCCKGGAARWHAHACAPRACVALLVAATNGSRISFPPRSCNGSIPTQTSCSFARGSAKSERPSAASKPVPPSPRPPVGKHLKSGSALAC
jgi:hypothetical protein